MSKPYKVTRTARRIFRPLLDADGPALLDLRHVDPDDAYQAIRDVGPLVRACDAPNPLEAAYVFVSGARGMFRPWHERVLSKLRSIFRR